MENRTLATRAEILRAAAETFGTQPEYLWQDTPSYAVLRHTEGRRWYAVLMTVPRARLGLPGAGAADILNVKCDPALAGSLRLNPGILPAYHMNKDTWLSVLLDGTVEGMECVKDRLFTVQFHPESAPGPQDSGYLFDKFVRLMAANKKD